MVIHLFRSQKAYSIPSIPKVLWLTVLATDSEDRNCIFPYGTKTLIEKGFLLLYTNLLAVNFLQSWKW